MKKYLLIIPAVIILAVAGRAYWAYQQMKNSKIELIITPISVPVNSETQQESATTGDKTVVVTQKINNSSTSKTEVSLWDIEKQKLIDQALQKISTLSEKEMETLAGKLIAKMYETPLSNEEEVLVNELSKKLSGKPVPDLEVKYTLIQEVNGEVQGILVPPAPDKAVNDATLAGIDTNVNGVRDDVERFIAQEFGANKEMYNFLMKSAKLLQAAIIEKQPPKMSEEEQLRLMKSGIENPSLGAGAQAFNAFLGCVRSSDKLNAMNLVDIATTNTGMRSAAYGKAFAGAVISGKNCPNL